MIRKSEKCIIYSTEIYVLVRFPRTHNDVKDTNGIVESFFDEPCIDTNKIKQIKLNNTYTKENT